MNDKPREDEPRRVEATARDQKPEQPRLSLGDRATDHRAQHAGRDSASPLAKSAEPPQLRSGKEFHAHLQKDAEQRFGAKTEKQIDIPDRRTGETTRKGRADLHYQADNPADKNLVGEIKVRNLARYEERGTTDRMVDSQSRQLGRYQDGLDHAQTAPGNTGTDNEHNDRPPTHKLMIIRDSSLPDDQQATELSAEDRQAYAEAVADATDKGEVPPPHQDADRLNHANDDYLAREEPDQRDLINIRHAMRGDEVHYDDERALHDDDHPLTRGHLGLDKAEDHLRASLGKYGDLRAFVERLRDEEER